MNGMGSSDGNASIMRFRDSGSQGPRVVRISKEFFSGIDESREPFSRLRRLSEMKGADRHTGMGKTRPETRMTAYKQ